MKKTSVFQISLLLLLVVIFITCTKENPLNHQNSFPDSASDRTPTDLYALETNDVSCVNGILCFKDNVTFERVRQSLIQISKDTSIINPYLRSKGITPGVDGDFHYPTYPACNKFNERLNFTSLFTYIESAENAILDSGGDFSDFPESTIVDPYLESMLNQYNEYKIKRIYYKLVDDNHFFIVTNDDLNALISLRNVEDPLNVELAPNVILIDTRVLEDINTYESLIICDDGDCCIPAFSVHNIGANTYKFTNTSVSFVGPINPNQISWKIFNGQNAVIATATGNEFVYTVPSNAIFPLSVQMSILNPCFETRTVQFADCSTPINIANLSAFEKLQPDIANDEFPDVTFTLTLEGVTGDYQVVWSFGDGSANVTVQNNYTVQHDFPAYNGNVNYTVCATVISAGNCARQICKTYNFGCGVTPNKLDHNWVTPQYKFRTELYIVNKNNSSYSHPA